MKRLLSVLLLLVPLVSLEARDPNVAKYIQEVADGSRKPGAVEENPGKSGWWARGWSLTEGNGFYGKPENTSRTSMESTSIVLRYTRYVTDYDLQLHSPLWGAYIVDKTTVRNDREKKRADSVPQFKRPGRFFTDELAADASRELSVKAATNETFTSTMDPRYPPQGEDDSPRLIQRGHMVPNNAMKCTGTPIEGQVAQIESFSVANIVPQIAASNSPNWAALEDACLDWANELGQTWIFVGPIYHDQFSPVLAVKRKNGESTLVPCPDELYYVVIGKRNGRTAAVAFLMPHTPENVDYKAKAVPVQKIEDLTGLNFMPELGEPNPIEEDFDRAWLATRPRPKTP